MHEASSRLKELYERYLIDQCSMEEQLELMAMIAEGKADPVFQALIDDTFDEPPVLHPLPEDRVENIFQVIRERNKIKRFSLRAGKWWAAAALLLAGTISTWYLVQKTETGKEPATVQVTDAAPAADHTGAILTLADGKMLEVNNLKKGQIAVQDGSMVEMTEQGIVYNESNTAASVVYNTMTTPKGRQFRLTLPDGTEVMLNAASSIRYPVSFQGNERLVFLQGEAWFNIKSNAAKPFRVEMPGQRTVEVLGTSFNIRCYQEEPVIKTTLLSGKVRFVNDEVRKVLVPGQQLQCEAGIVKVLQSVDTSHVMAWKNGEFSFRNLSLSEAIRELARWYDLKPEFTGKLPAFEFYGSMGRNLSIQQVINHLNNMGLHVSLENNRLIIAP